MKTFIVWELATCRVANYVKAETKEEARQKVIDWENVDWVELEEVVESLQIDEADEFSGMLPDELQG